VQAARERFATDGFLNVGVPELAETAGRSAASFYTYFDSKEALLQLLAADALAELEAALASALGATAGGATDVDVDVAIERVTAAIWWAYRDHRAAFTGVFQQATRDLELGPWRRVRDVLVGAIESVNARAGVGDLATARALASMLENCCLEWGSPAAKDAPGSDTASIQILAAIWRGSRHGSAAA
jgi:AcrR family transcriptional regulator